MVVNNIINSLNGETYVAPDSTAGMFSGSNNLFFGAGATPTFSSASKNADPKFVTPGSNFQLQSGSPAIDAGISSGFNRDIIQTSRPQGTAYDMGAYEYAGSCAGPPNANADSASTVTHTHSFAELPRRRQAAPLLLIQRRLHSER